MIIGIYEIHEYSINICNFCAVNPFEILCIILRIVLKIINVRFRIAYRHLSHGKKKTVKFFCFIHLKRI